MIQIPPQRPKEETDPFKMAGMQIPLGLHRLMTPTRPHREDVPSEVVQSTLCGSTD
jgi:hypothetical protein